MTLSSVPVWFLEYISLRKVKTSLMPPLYPCLNPPPTFTFTVCDVSFCQEVQGIWFTITSSFQPFARGFRFFFFFNQKEFLIHYRAQFAEINLFEMPTSLNDMGWYLVENKVATLSDAGLVLQEVTHAWEDVSITGVCRGPRKVCQERCLGQICLKIEDHLPETYPRAWNELIAFNPLFLQQIFR